MPVIVDEHTQYVNEGGKPLVNGKVFIGVVNQDPVTNPEPIFSDFALTILTANPQSLNARGQTVNKIYAAGRYSFKLENSAGSQIEQDLDRGSIAAVGITALTNIQGTNTITASSNNTIAAYVDKAQVSLTIINSPTGATTLNIDGLGAVAIKNKGVDILPGQLPANGIIVVAFNTIGPVFELVSGANLSVPSPIGDVTPNSIQGTTIEGTTIKATTTFEATSGTTINEFSTDGTLAGNSDDAVPTEQAVKTAIETLSPFGNQLLHIQDQKTTGTDGGTFSSGAERTRDLNTVLTNEIAGASLASNRITLPAGTYFIMASSPAFLPGRHRAKVRDLTGAFDLIIGSSEFSGSAASVSTRSEISGRFNLATLSLIEIQHRSEITSTSFGFGLSVNFGPHEVYTDVKIWKVS